MVLTKRAAKNVPTHRKQSYMVGAQAQLQIRALQAAE
jgi:hypothetical protein